MSETNYRSLDGRYTGNYSGATKADHWELWHFEMAVRDFDRTMARNLVHNEKLDQMYDLEEQRVVPRPITIPAWMQSKYLTEQETRDHYHKLRTAYEAIQSMEGRSV